MSFAKDSFKSGWELEGKPKIGVQKVPIISGFA